MSEQTNHLVSQILSSLIKREDDSVFYTNESSVTARQIASLAARVAYHVSHLEQKSWIVQAHDSHNFVSVLLGVALAGKEVVLPPNTLPGTISDICLPDWGVIGDDLVLEGVDPPGRVLPHVVTIASLGLSPEEGIEEPKPILESFKLFTSGSTGRPKVVEKKWSDISAEINQLESIFGLNINGLFVSTVSHQHIYGLIFKVLWPLYRGGTVYSPLVEFPELLLKLAKEQTGLVLVSSPAFLKRTIHYESVSALGSSLNVVFSSGGSLSSQVSAAWRQLNNESLKVFEVYGSSESGGVAWRDPSKSQLWTPFPDVDISVNEDGVLMIRSGHSGSGDLLQMSDSVRLVEYDKFELSGRVDRIVKIEEKRVSLQQIENLILDHPFVSEVSCLLLSAGRSQIGVVFVLTDTGIDFLCRKGKNALTKTLKARLANYIDRVGIPKKWRITHCLPRNTQGKVPLSGLQQYFDDKCRDRPEIVSWCSSEAKAVLKLFISPQMTCFDGHFPGSPVVPGVSQLDWVDHFAGRQFSGLKRFGGMEVIKFKDIIRPKDLVDLSLDYQPEKGKVVFSISCGDNLYSSGRLRFSSINE